jgi:hypothetical protein
MPVVEKTFGGTVRVRDIGEFAPGDRAEVSTADAAYLVDERGDFEVVDADASDEVHEEDGPPDESGAGEAAPAVDPGDLTVADLREALDEGDYSVAELEAVREAEQADDDPRTSALDAIDSAIADVEG